MQLKNKTVFSLYENLCVCVVSKYLQKILRVNESFLINQDAHIVLIIFFLSYSVWQG